MTVPFWCWMQALEFAASVCRSQLRLRGSIFYSLICTWITYRDWGFLVHSLTLEPTFTYGGLRAACSRLRLAWVGICRLLFFRYISVTCLVLYVMRYHAQHLKLVHSEYGRRLSVIRVRQLDIE